MIKGNYEYKSHRGVMYRRNLSGGPWETQIKDENARDDAINRLKDSIKAEEIRVKKEKSNMGLFKRVFSKKVENGLSSMRSALKELEMGRADALVTNWQPVEGNPFNA